MSLVLELPPELEAALSSEAADLGLPLSEYALRLLAGVETKRAMPGSGAELVSYWQSEKLVGTRPDIADSCTHARQAREEAQRRGQPES